MGIAPISSRVECMELLLSECHHWESQGYELRSVHVGKPCCLRGSRCLQLFCSVVQFASRLLKTKEQVQ